MKTLVLALVLAAFSALTAYALEVHGYLGFFEALVSSTAGVVVLTDLVISLTLVMLWMRSDARERGLPSWPYLLLTLALGSVGPLSYLIHREVRARAPRHATA
jgi:Terpene cyclase DEP1